MTNEDQELFDLFCDEMCKHCDPLNSFCWRLWKHIKPYDPCHAGFKRDINGFIIYHKEG